MTTKLIQGNRKVPINYLPTGKYTEHGKTIYSGVIKEFKKNGVLVKGTVEFIFDPGVKYLQKFLSISGYGHRIETEVDGFDESFLVNQYHSFRKRYIF